MSLGTVEQDLPPDLAHRLFLQRLGQTMNAAWLTRPDLLSDCARRLLSKALALELSAAIAEKRPVQAWTLEVGRHFKA